MKRCTKCQQVKLLEAFHRHRGGRRPDCAACVAVRRAAWNLLNQERERQRSRDYAATHADEANARARAYRRRTGRAAQRRWAAEHPAEVRASKAAAKHARRGATMDADARAYVEIIRRDPCCYCAGPCEEIDHVHPIALGGDGDYLNLAPACARCNRAKNATPLLRFLLTNHTHVGVTALGSRAR